MPDYIIKGGTHIATRCMICGEPVAIEWIYDSNKVCDKCRAAIMKMRSNMEQEG